VPDAGLSFTLLLSRWIRRFPIDKIDVIVSRDVKPHRGLDNRRASEQTHLRKHFSFCLVGRRNAIPMSEDLLFRAKTAGLDQSAASSIPIETGVEKGNEHVD